MVFICTSLCPLDVGNLLWISPLSRRRKEQHRNTQNLDKMLKKNLQLNNYQSDFRHLRGHRVTWNTAHSEVLY